MTSVQFEQFYVNRLIKDSGVTSTTDIHNEYIKYTGFKSGRNNLYKYLESIDGVTRGKNVFIGISIKKDNNVVEEKNEDIVEKKIEDVENNKSEKTMSAFEEAMLKIAMEKEARKAAQAIKQEELANKLKQMEIESANKLKQMEIESDNKLKQMDLEFAREKEQNKIEEAERNRAFLREENNKNRQMYIATKFNKYLDLEVYGSPANQYITANSLINVSGYDNYNMTNVINNAMISNKINEASEDVIIYKDGKSSEVKAVDVKKVNDLFEDIKEVSEDLKEKVAKISEIAVRDENRNIISNYEEKKNVIIQDKINGVKHAKLDKRKYSRKENESKYIDNDIWIKCSCCKNSIKLDEDGCHRGHNIPASDGGDWSKDNIYLICATCNLNMSDKMTIDDYKVSLYIEKLENPAGQVKPFEYIF